jgi:hypothetical protein
MWQWLNCHVAPLVRAEKWYDDRPAQKLNAYINDFSSIIVGFPTLRQLRVETG